MDICLDQSDYDGDDMCDIEDDLVLCPKVGLVSFKHNMFVF